jgi:hypothetical protein
MPTLDNAHALVIGISDYDHVARLPRVLDAEAVAALLVDPAHCGYAPANVRQLLNAQATKEAILRELYDLSVRSDANSTVFFYFSGHGGRIASGPRAGEYLLPVETKYPTDEDMANTAISAKEFSDALRRVPSKKAIVVLDCCHAGGLGEAKAVGQAKTLEPGPVQPDGLSEGYYESLASGSGRAVLASSRADQLSYVPGGSDYGLFTRHLLGGLRGGARSDDGLVRVFALYNYVRQQVVAAARRDQVPYFKFSGDEDLPVALYRGGSREERSAPDDEFFHDAYVCFADREPDKGYVWKTLVPRLEREGVRVAVSGDAEEPGVDRVAGIEAGVRKAKRTLLVLTDAFLQDHVARFQDTLAQTIGLDKGQYRVLPVRIGPMNEQAIPATIKSLTTVDLVDPYTAERQWQRLVRALKGPVPERGR